MRGESCVLVLALTLGGAGRAGAVTVFVTDDQGAQTTVSLQWSPQGDLFVASLPASDRPLRVVLGRDGLEPANWGVLLGTDRLIHANRSLLVATRRPVPAETDQQLTLLAANPATGALTSATCAGNETGSMAVSLPADPDARTLTVSIAAIGNPRDLNVDGAVNTADLVLLLRWIPGIDGPPIQPVPCLQAIPGDGGGDALRSSPDITRDGTVDVADLVELLFHFGEGTGGG